MLIDDFISMNGKYCLNVNELLRKQLIHVVNQVQPVEQVMDQLEVDVEFLMLDTFKVNTIYFALHQFLALQKLGHCLTSIEKATIHYGCLTVFDLAN